MKLQTKLLAAFLAVAVIPLILVSGSTYFAFKQSRLQEIENHLESVAAIQRARIENTIDQNLERLSLVTSRTQLRISLRDFNNSKKPDLQAGMNRILDDARSSIADFKSLSIADEAGAIVASTDRQQIGGLAGESEWFQGGLRQNRVDLISLTSDQTLSLIFSGPLVLDGRLLGVLRIESSLQNLLESIQDYTGLGSSGEVMLLDVQPDGQGIFILPTRFNPNAALRLKYPEQNTGLLARALEGERVFTDSALDYRGKEVLAVIRHVEPTDWICVVKIDTQEAYQPLLRLRQWLLLIGVIISAAAGLGALALADNMIRPILRLTHAARQIAQGIVVRADESLQDETGILARSFNSMTEKLISERSKAEEISHDLRASEARVQLIMDSVDALVYVVDSRSCEVIYINAYGKKQMGDVSGMICWQSMQGGITGPCVSCLGMDHSGQDRDAAPPRNWEMRHGDTGQWFDVHASEIRWQDGRLVRLVAAIDITEKKQAEEALRQAHDQVNEQLQQRTAELQKTFEQLLHAEKLSAVGSLSASIAHEFNNPLQGVLNILKGSVRRLSIPEEDRSLLKVAVSECNRMRDLIRSLNDFNRPTTRRSGIIDIHALLDDLLLLTRKEFKTKNIAVDTRYAENLPRIVGVADQLKQVFLNLLNNASYACETGGKITIITEKTDDGISVRISDTGVGIRAEDMGRIFEPFFTTKPGVKGIGLGLRGYGIIREHGGRIMVSSLPGNGATFSVNLPVQREAMEKSVLLVDDEPSILSSFSRDFRYEGSGSIPPLMAVRRLPSCAAAISI